MPRRLLYITALAVALLTQSASADMITQTIGFGPGQTNWSISNPNIQQFDPSLGTLNSVELTFSGSSWGWLQLVQQSNNTADLSSSFGAQISLSDALQNPIFTILPLNTFTDHVTGQQTILHTVPWASAAADSASATYTTDLGRWIGTGTWDVTAAATGIVTVQSNNLKPTSETQAAASLTVVYNYDGEAPPEVPEPAGYLLIGSGLLGLGLLLRRRSA